MYSRLDSHAEDPGSNPGGRPTSFTAHRYRGNLFSAQNPTEGMTPNTQSSYHNLRSANALGKLRMLLELKRDGRRKGRLIINKESVEWQTGSDASPVAYLESIRMMVFMCGCF